MYPPQDDWGTTGRLQASTESLLLRSYLPQPVTLPRVKCQLPELSY